MGKSSISTLVSVQLANEITQMLDRRAKARGLSRSRYAAMIFENWRDQKFPALDTVDSTARAVVMQQLNDEKSKATNPQKGSPARPIAKATDTAQKQFPATVKATYSKPTVTKKSARPAA